MVTTWQADCYGNDRVGFDESEVAMKYYCFDAWKTDPSLDHYVEVMSEQEILDQYWSYWYERMCAKFGKEVVDRDYCKDDCIDDWVVVNLGWESTDK
jgi:hypothetical protein